MKRLSVAQIAPVLFGLVFGHAAAADPSWSLISFATTPENAPKVIAATDKLMSSEVGKQFPGKLLLQVSVADGANPATHSFVPIYKTVAEREAFVQKLQATPAWGEFLAAMTASTEPVSQVLYKTLGHWGEIVDTDRLWMVYAFNVSDPAAFAAAIEKFVASPTGQKFPGQVYLSSVVAGGITQVTHVISVGYASEAEMDAWVDIRNASADWQAYLNAANPVSDFLGASMARTLKTWGPATLADIVAP
jgi:hypothetical protein